VQGDAIVLDFGVISPENNYNGSANGNFITAGMAASAVCEMI
jgi:hypothetical protein